MSRLALGLVLALAACSPTGSSSGADAGTTDACSKPFDACNPPSCATGNDKGVGQYCSPGGGECDALDQAYGGFNQCSIDLDPEGSNFCVRLFCHSNAECGEDACCTGRDETGPRACVPRSCVVAHPDDPCPAVPSDDDGGTSGADGGSGDADGGT